jgi:hypothetical protein
MSDSVFKTDTGLQPVTTTADIERIDAASPNALSQAADRADRHTPITDLWGLPPHVLRERAEAAEWLTNTRRHLGDALETARRARAHAGAGELTRAPLMIIDAVIDMLEAADVTVATAADTLTTLGDAA